MPCLYLKDNKMSQISLFFRLSHCLNNDMKKMKRMIIRYVCDSVILSFVQFFVTHMDCSPARFLCPWDFPGNNIGVGCHFQLWEFFPTQRLNLYLLHLLLGRQIPYC